MTKTIAILVPTFRRPEGLKATLDGIAGLTFARERGIEVVVIVADNDADGRGGFAQVEAMRDSYRWPLHGLVVPDRGIPFVRNALLVHAIEELGATASVFIDDDEVPQPRWLDHLIETREKFAVDVVGGSVRPVFETTPPDWATSLGLFETPVRPTGPVDLVNSTANVWVDSAVVTRLPKPWFNEAAGLAGGTDKEFFTRLKKMGATFAWSEEALVIETIPASRTTVKWILTRAYRIGNSDMALKLAHMSRTHVAAELVNSAAACAVATGSICVLFPLENQRIKALRRFYRQAGKLAALRGKLYQEYRVIHGK